MKALVRFGHSNDEIELRDVPEPSPAPNEVKIEVKAAGVCGTDIQGHPALRLPVILGHELAGVVVDTGRDCKTRKVGDRVTSQTTKYRCGECRFCRQGPASLCIRRKGMASSVDGCFTKYVTILEESTFRLPDHVSFEAGALCEPLACATHAVIEQGAVQPGETAVVLGPGALGLLITQCAAVLGVKVVVAGTDADVERLALARKFGAVHTVDVTSEHLPEVVKRMTDGYGADVVFECSGVAPAVAEGLACCRKRARFVQAGILHKHIALDFDDIFFVRELSLIGSHTSNPHSWSLAMMLLSERRIDLQPLVNAELPLADWKRAFELMRTRQAIKVVLKP